MKLVSFSSFITELVYYCWAESKHGIINTVFQTPTMMFLQFVHTRDSTFSCLRLEACSDLHYIALYYTLHYIIFHDYGMYLKTLLGFEYCSFEACKSHDHDHGMYLKTLLGFEYCFFEDCNFHDYGMYL